MSCYKQVRGLAIVWYMIVTHLQGHTDGKLFKYKSIKYNFYFISFILSLFCH